MSATTKQTTRVLGAAMLAFFCMRIQIALADSLKQYEFAQTQTPINFGKQAMAAHDDGAGIEGEKPGTGAESMAYLRWSELEIDPDQLDSFKSLAEENVRETRLTEPGVQAFYWAREKDHPNRIRVLEIYTNADAYQAHLQSSHFEKFRVGSRHLLTSRRLFEAVPIALGSKPQTPPTDAHVRIAELEIDLNQLEAYKDVVIEEINTSILVEPGVFAIYAFATKDRPNHLRFYEIYADEYAYKHHLETPHFRKYLESTQSMIVTRRLIDIAPH